MDVFARGLASQLASVREATDQLRDLLDDEDLSDDDRDRVVRKLDDLDIATSILEVAVREYCPVVDERVAQALKGHRRRR